MQTWKLVGEFNFSALIGFADVSSHVQLPTPLIIDHETLRIFFASRNSDEIPSIYHIDMKVTPENGDLCWLPFTGNRVLGPGQGGTFDEHGVYPSHIIRDKEDYVMFYIGWNRGNLDQTFVASVGVATSNDGINFVKKFKGPVLSRSKNEPFLTSSPFVEKINDHFRMTYTSGTDWIREKGKWTSRYDLKSIESNSLFEWNTINRKTVLALQARETNIARAWITNVVNEKKFLYFCFVEKTSTEYQLGVAEEDLDGTWKRLENEIFIEGINAGEVSAYPSVVQVNSRILMLVNGRSYGKECFYVLELQETSES
jgi:predicted GH43/DUF377 family glycosyl hydrolase